ncbi:unnamed protein product [Paramecium octaurelia]|uniref:Transmembrane protein n=1 Tax=Paramecium octaurelia TaxID=43137 RepID=A0A8S1WXF5_PAROT|nr:unnamed protein product [Paramecium octaurelia]
MFNLKQLLIALHHITIILYFNRLQYSIQEILQNQSNYSYKLVNDFSAQSIKMVYQSIGISLAFYMIFTASYVIQLIVLFFRSNKNLNRYIYYHIYLLILLYSVGQLVQIYYYNFQEELTKLTAYQNEENKQDALKDLQEEGQLAQTIWQLYFMCTVIIIVVFKISYLYFGLHQFVKFMEIEL